MTDSIYIDGKTIALTIKRRAKAVNKTVYAICREADVSYRTYLSWRSHGADASFASLKKIEAVLQKYEAA